MSVSSKFSCSLLWLALLTGITFFALFILPLFGRTCCPIEVLFRFPTHATPISELDSQARIFWGDRFPKTFLAMLAGSGLSLSGLILQTLFRNPLATPYTLGIASGASLGAVLALYLSPALSAIGISVLFLGITHITWGAFFGALLATAIVYFLARSINATPEHMLLAGVVVSFFFSSLILCLQYVSNPTQTFKIIRWTIGSIDIYDTVGLFPLTMIVMGSGIVLCCFFREMNLLLAGQEHALALGLNIFRFRLFLFLLSSLLVGAVVALCGPIGFVGLMVPHISRLMVGKDHRVLIPVTTLTGALFLGLCFTFSRIILYPGVLPVGILTSMLGGPFFLILLYTRKNL